MKARRRKKFLAVFVGMLFLITMLPLAGNADVPNLINYQGMLTDGEGAPVTDFALPMTFRIYNVVTGGTPLWEENQDVNIQDGIYNVLLGSGSTTIGSFDPALFSAAGRWLEVVVNGEALEPRQQVTSVAFSFQAEKAVSADTADYADAAGDADTVDGQQAADFC